MIRNAIITLAAVVKNETADRTGLFGALLLPAEEYNRYRTANVLADLVLKAAQR